MMIALLTAGCGGPPPATQPPEAAPPSGPEADSAITMTGVEYTLHVEKPTQGKARKPMLWIRAEKGQAMEDGAMRFENATAISYGESEDDEVVEFKAKLGRFDEARETAILEGGVTAQLGDMTIELEDIYWESPREDKPGLGYTDNPVKIMGPGLQLMAESMKLYPETKRIELYNGSGTLPLGKDRL